MSQWLKIILAVCFHWNYFIQRKLDMFYGRRHIELPINLWPLCFFKASLPPLSPSRSPCTSATRYHSTPNRNQVPANVAVNRKNLYRHCMSRNVVQRSRMYRALRPLTCSMRTLLRPSLDRTRLLFLSVPPPLEMPPPSKGFKTSVCVCEWQTFWGEELREEGGVADVIWWKKEGLFYVISLVGLFTDQCC